MAVKLDFTTTFSESDKYVSYLEKDDKMSFHGRYPRQELISQYIIFDVFRCKYVAKDDPKAKELIAKGLQQLEKDYKEQEIELENHKSLKDKEDYAF